MKLDVQYVNDSRGITQAVQLPFNEWKDILARLKKYEQALKLRTDLKEALEEVSIMRKLKRPKQTLSEFLDEL